MDPILDATPDRYVLFPIAYPDIYALYKRSLDSFWRAEEVQMDKDLRDWNTLSKQEKEFILSVLAFFAASDGIVMQNLCERFQSDVQVAEAKSFYAVQNCMEAVHSEMYSILIDTLAPIHERERLFRAVEYSPSIKRKQKWAEHYMGSRSEFSERLVAFACVEGIFFSGSFAAIFWLKKRGLMPGLTLSNEFISRDEALHTEFAILLHSKLRRPITKELAKEIVISAVSIEQEFITDSLPCRLIGMNSKSMKEYIEFVGDRLMLQLGFEKIYMTANPFDFMELISIDSKANFFERTVSAYALANKEVKSDCFDFSTEF
jgi:ribonucleoside-diphosphate reductase subunit M2